MSPESTTVILLGTSSTFAAQIANVRARLVDTELRVKEAEDLEERISRLEQTQAEGGKRWAR